jgi:Ca2+-binding RTX toxin-like protein
VVRGALIGAATLPWVASADAAAVTVERGAPPIASTVFVRAGTGELNDLLITRGGGVVTVSERGSAPMSTPPASGCGITGSTATCGDDGVTVLFIDLGDGADQLLVTTATDTTVIGGGGNDMIELSGGNDLVRAQGEDDTIRGGDGSDLLYGDDASEIDPATGADRIEGGPGNDTASGGRGNDVIAGDDGADMLRGGSADDSLFGGAGADRLSGEQGADEMDGGVDDDVVGIPGTVAVGAALAPAEPGNDVVVGGPGDDALDPGSGDGGDDDTLVGGDGRDSVSYTLRSAPVATLKDGVANDGQAGEHDEIDLDVERLVGGLAGDTIGGGPGDDEIDGGPGDDAVLGFAGHDVLNGGAADGGSDTVEGGDGPDEVIGDGGNDRLSGGAGEDALRGGPSQDMLDGGQAMDRLEGGDGPDALIGGPGPDEMLGGPGQDDAVYPDTDRPVAVKLDGRANDGEVIAGKPEGDDVARDVEDVTGASQEDTFSGDGASNRLSSGAGEDYVDGRSGSDLLQGGAGPDTVRARDRDADRVTCGGNRDLAIVDRRDTVARRGLDRCEMIEDGSSRAPTAGERVFVQPQGCVGEETVQIQLPGTSRTVPLADDVRLPVRTAIGPGTGCRVQLTADNGRSPNTIGAVTSDGRFSVLQSGGRSPATTLRVDHPGCGRGRGRAAVRASKVKLSTKRRGRWRVRGRYSIAASHGTEWTTIARCDRTITIVHTGRVRVKDLVRGRSVTLGPSERYTARQS